MVWPHGVPKLSRAAVGKIRRRRIERHVIDDPPLADGPALGLEPLVNAQLHRIDRRLHVGRAGDRREHLTQDQVPRIVGERQDAAREAREARYRRTNS